MVLCAVALTFTSARAQDAADLVKVELLAEPAAIVPGEPFTVGIKLSTKNIGTRTGEIRRFRRADPGDMEIAGRLCGRRSAMAGPSLIRVGPVASFGYEGDAILLARSRPRAT